LGKNIRNVAIILLLSVAVWLLPGAGLGSQAAYTLLLALFVVAMVFFCYKVYMEHRETIYSLGDRNRALLYGSLALAAITLIATPKMWASGLGSALWIMLLGLSMFGCYRVYRAYKRY
jgi:hypothetical protein